MANSEEKDLMGIGSHCAFSECGQVDFLPFRCDCCKRVFCVEHRTYAAHQCPVAGAKEVQVFVCPLCARAVKVAAGGDANAAFDRHCRTECDPSNYDRVHKKKKCPVQGCKEKLTSINSYTCKDCATTVCLKHRLGSDHKCPGKAAAAAAAAQSRFGGLPQAFRGLFSSGKADGAAAKPTRPARATAAAKPAAAAAAAGAAATAGAKAAGGKGLPRGSASSSSSSVAQQLQDYRAQQAQRGGAGGAAAAAAAAALPVVDLTSSPAAAGPTQSGGAEVCQQCGARFPGVQQLIEHAEHAHMDGWRSGSVGGAAGASGGGGGLERCPHCGRQFADAVELVSHVEREHAASRGGRESCVLC